MKKKEKKIMSDDLNSPPPLIDKSTDKNYCKSVRGMHDILPEDMHKMNHVIGIAKDVALRYGFNMIATPIVEFSPVFKRTLGDMSDVVSKEMYVFNDRAGDSLTLRPENTAGVARAFISNGLQEQLPCKFFYAGPMFRYERPQKGRLRQFHQIGLELLGVENFLADADIIACGWDILKNLAIHENIILELNTLGDMASRHQYRQALIDYFSGYKHDLSDDSQMRLLKNPLRILDSKDEKDKEIVANAPLLSAYLNNKSRQFFDDLQNRLTILSIPYHLNPHLVRGLDYYCHTAFEFTTNMLGAQGTVMGGGRYDGLVEQLGGNPTFGVGWAAGIERLMMMCDTIPAIRAPIALIPLGDRAEKQLVFLSQNLRDLGHRVEYGYSGNMKRRLKYANKIGANFAIIFGDDELQQNKVLIKNMQTGEQSDISMHDIGDFLHRH